MDKYAVIGNPVEHSLSPIIYQAFATQTNQKFIYYKITAPIDGFAPTARQFQEEGGKGLNITVPFKQEAYQFATQCSLTAQEAKAVSVLHFREDRMIYGDNFDGLGLVRDLIQNYQLTLTKKKILIVGAGGAAQGILGPLLDLLPAQIVIANRTGDKAHQLACAFHKRGPVQGISFDELEPMPYDIIFHVTSLGHQEKIPPLPNNLISKDTYCYDISYGKTAQTFLHWAKMQGAKKCFDGLGMLVEHNAAVFNLWFGTHPDTAPVINMLRKKINS